MGNNTSISIMSLLPQTIAWIPMHISLLKYLNDYNRLNIKVSRNTLILQVEGLCKMLEVSEYTSNLNKHFNEGI